MKTLCSLLIILAAVTSHTFADVQFTFPTAGAREVGNTAVYIAWKESGKGPAISSFDKYNLSLCAGGNSPGSYVCGKLAAMRILLCLLEAIIDTCSRRLKSCLLPRGDISLQEIMRQILYRQK